MDIHKPKSSSTSRRCFAPALAVLGLLAAAAPAWAADAPDRSQQQAAFQGYTNAWQATSDGARQQLLKDALAPGMTYQDASVRAEGVAGVDAMIARFQHQSPGVGLRLDDQLLWADHGLARWSMTDPKGGLIMHGYDVVTYDAAGRIKSIVGFFDIPGQRQAAAR
ncbi:hypothetical protein [Phenylobacterium sp.]|uniref:hypothetical protein n=1 Tax=Phenylobacterium sp. TaxID=1871053 RepID=UPI002B95EAB3|nr:hypothetical protein [Phenylobacterium sp.]HLZ76951.1 hypothetical protein [Phenylobacterium sp.]